MSDRPTCKVCGDPMPEGEEMFQYHGYSGPCPKPPLPQKETLRRTPGRHGYFQATGEYGDHWYDITLCTDARILAAAELIRKEVSP